MIGGSASGYISKLEDAYGLVEKVQPIFETKSNKGCAYRIRDNFFRFWFRFVYKYNYLVELQLYDDLRKIVERDYAVFSGLALEGYFKAKFAEAGAYTRMGAWWDRRGTLRRVCAHSQDRGVLCQESGETFAEDGVARIVPEGYVRKWENDMCRGPGWAMTRRNIAICRWWVAGIGRMF